VSLPFLPGHRCVVIEYFVLKVIAESNPVALLLVKTTIVLIWTYTHILTRKCIVFANMVMGDMLYP
jgi:hypothetical protein